MNTRYRLDCVWTLALVASAVLLAPLAMAQDTDYEGQNKCKMCHNKKSTGEQWSKWKATKHAIAYETLLTDAAKELSKKVGLETPPAESPECLRCHVTGYDPETKTFHPNMAKEDGVQCESCHGRGTKHLAYGKKMLGKDPAESDLPKDILRPDSTTCVTCHNEQSPAWNPEKYTLEDGTKVGFDFDQALQQIAHLNPEKKREEPKP